jgi:RsiW-degrading membrane proteinase PrsW (M82 family)
MGLGEAHAIYISCNGYEIKRKMKKFKIEMQIFPIWFFIPMNVKIKQITCIQSIFIEANVFFHPL